MSVRTCTAYAGDPQTGYSRVPLRPCGQRATHLSTLRPKAHVRLPAKCVADLATPQPRCTGHATPIDLSVLVQTLTPIR